MPINGQDELIYDPETGLFITPEEMNQKQTAQYVPPTTPVPTPTPVPPPSGFSDLISSFLPSSFSPGTPTGAQPGYEPTTVYSGGQVPTDTGGANTVGSSGTGGANTLAVGVTDTTGQPITIPWNQGGPTTPTTSPQVAPTTPTSPTLPSPIPTGAIIAPSITGTSHFPTSTPTPATPTAATPVVAPTRVTPPTLPVANFSNLVQPANFIQAPVPQGIGGNYAQVQNAAQGGQFATTNQSAENALQLTGENTSSDQTGATSSNTASNQTDATSSDTSSQTTTAPVDTLGFGGLLKSQADGTVASDAARSGFLQDVMNTGGTAFNSQVNQAVRNALTGPQMTGAGDSARARAAGYAGAEIGRTNLNQRLGAAEQLAGPTGLASLSTAANPYVGSTSGTTGSADSISNVLNNTTQSGLSRVLNNTAQSGFSSLAKQGLEATQGSTTAQSSQAGAGTIPEGQSVKTGGCVLCTAAIDLGLSNHRRVLRAVINHKLNVDWNTFRHAARGYFALFTPVARWLLGHPRIARILWPLAKATVYEELRVSGRKLPLRIGAWLVHWTGHGVCSLIGHLPVRGYITDPEIIRIARREGILFSVKGGC